MNCSNYDSCPYTLRVDQHNVAVLVAVVRPLHTVRLVDDIHSGGGDDDGKDLLPTPRGEGLARL